MSNEMLHPREIGVRYRGRSEFPALIVLQEGASPVAVVKRRICQHIIGLKVGMQVMMKAIGMLSSEIAINTSDGEIHLRKPPGRMITLLAVNANLTPRLSPISIAVCMCLHKLNGLDKHAAGAAARIKHTTLIGCQHLYKQAHDASRSIELPALLSFGAGELGKKVFVHPAENILRPALAIPQADVRNKVNRADRGAACPDEGGHSPLAARP